MKKCFGLLLCGLLATSSIAETVPSGETQTYCFGRFLVDVPREAILIGQGNRYYDHAKNIETGHGKEEFHVKVKEKLEDRMKGKAGSDIYDYLRMEYPEGGDNQIIVSKADLLGDIAYKIDVFALRKLGRYFYFGTAPLGVEWVDKSVVFYRDKILPALRYRPDNEIPKEPGFCFENGFIALNGEQEWIEEASLTLQLKDYPDVWISIRSEVYFVAEESLIEGHEAAKAEGNVASWIRVDSVRKREVNNIQGDELLLSGTNDGYTVYSYEWDTKGELKNPLKPALNVMIEAGRPVKGRETSSSLTKEQVRALYETVLKSLRFRPVETPKPQAKAPRFPRLATGDRCPQTGWWYCIQTERVVRVLQGQNMPWVMYDKPATGLLNWLRGNDRTFSHQGPGIFAWVGEQWAAKPDEELLD